MFSVCVTTIKFSLKEMMRNHTLHGDFYRMRDIGDLQKVEETLAETATCFMITRY